MDDPSLRPTYDKDRLSAYFEHVGLPQTTHDAPQDLKTLRTVQQHQLAKVPFENLSLHYSLAHDIYLDHDLLFDKIVGAGRGRGGYCMENSLFFGTVLRSLGYTVRTVGARINAAMSSPGKLQFTGWSHMVNIVTVDDKEYMVDVGFGFKGPTAPMLLEHGHEEDNISPGRMRLMYEKIPAQTDLKQRVWLYQHQSLPMDDWRTMYSFTELEFFPADYEVMNFYTSQYRKCWFTYTIVVVKFIMFPERGLIGAHVLLGAELKEHIGADTQVLKTCKTEDDRIKVLEEYFDVKLSNEERKGIAGMCTQLHG